MNRPRRSNAATKKSLPVVAAPPDSDDDFESDDPVDATQSDGDFSVSEEEWLPGGGGKKGGDTVSDEAETEELDDDDDEGDSGGDSVSDESVVATRKPKAKRSSTSSLKRQVKRKRLSPGAREELYKRTKKHLLKEKDPERPPLNASVADILQRCQFQRKKNMTEEVAVKAVRKRAAAQNDESESSGDEHLVDPEKLDLRSNFFDRVEKSKEKTDEPPKFDCNAGMRLSDSSDGEEPPEGNLPSSIPKLAADKLISKINESSGEFLNFNDLGKFNQKIEEAKELLKNYKAKEATQGSQESKGADISNLLALGETEVGVPPGGGAQGLKKSSQVSEPQSEESDWEEVEDADNAQPTAKEPPENGLITVEVETAKTKKKRWEEIEMELFIKRQINKVKRDKQMSFHKSSVLLTVAEGRKLNAVVNSGWIQGLMLSLMQDKRCLTKAKSDGKFVDQLVCWFKDTFELRIQGHQSFSMKFSLALELFTRRASSKRNYILLFLACLRAAGVEARLVISANAPPKRPAMKDLCPISERQLIEQFEREYCRKGRLAGGSASETSPDNSLVEEEKLEDSREVVEVNISKGSEKEDEPVKNVAEKGKPKKGAKKQKVQKNPEIKLPPQEATTSTDSSKKLRFSPEPEVCGEASKSPSSKENTTTRKSILKRTSPRNKTQAAKPSPSSSSRRALNTLNIPQLDGLNDLEDVTGNTPLAGRLRSRERKAAAKASTSRGVVEPPFSKRATNTPPVKEKKAQPGQVLKRKLFNGAGKSKLEDAKPKQDKKPPAKNKILVASSESETEEPPEKVVDEPDVGSWDDSDFEPPVDKKARKAPNTARKKKMGSTPQKVKPSKKVEKPSKKVEKLDESITQTKTDLWIEFYSGKDKRWIAIDLASEKVDCVDYVARHATAPISYVFGFDNQNHVKDITPRYVAHWNTVSRKLRVEPKWLDKALKPFRAPESERDSLENAELNKIDLDKPLPTTIAECKNHPLYVLKRHLLKFEALYPPDLPSLGFVRGEAIYARECLFILQTREKWYKQGRVVKAFESAYKVVKCWKYDKLKNEWVGNQPCDIFGEWQTEEYDPPTAEGGRVPRNEYGNVELFVPRMLPKKTVHLQLPGLNRVCRRLGIDCAPALTGFEKARMRMVPVYDGFVVCEEFAEQVTEEWYKEMEEEEQREQERFEKRVYGNWKRLIKGLLVRRRLQNKYNFDNL